MPENNFAYAYADFFQMLRKESAISEYGQFFDAHSTFEDPFQKVTGLEAIYRVFAHMYITLDAPHFIIDEIVTNHHKAYLRWHFRYNGDQSFTGVSRVEFNALGKVISHIDYWDSGSAVYEKIPILKSLIKMIKKRLRA